MRIFITGVSGFFGQHLARHFLAKGDTVRGVSRHDPQISGLDFHAGNVTDPSIRSLMDGMDVVFHCAAITEHDAIVNHPRETLQTNVQGTLNVIEGFIAAKGKHFVFPSTGKVYGKPQYLPYDEAHPAEPTTILGKSKKITEEVVRLCAETYPDGKFSVLRVFNIYGPGQKDTFLMPVIVKQIESGTVKLGDIEAKRDYVHIADLVSAFEAALAVDMPENFRLWNVGTNRATSAKEIVEIFAQITGKKLTAMGDPSRVRKDEWPEEKATSGLSHYGWKPQYSLEEGLKTLL